MDFKTSKNSLTRQIGATKTLSAGDIANRVDFRAWFGKSKITDSKGLPLEVYHGGLRFDAFRSNPEALAHFASDDYAVADGYADQFPREQVELKALFLRVENPLDLRDPDTYEKWVGVPLARCEASSEWGMRTFMAQNCIQVRAGGALLAAAKRNGHDGVIFYDTDVRNRGYHTTVAFFEPEQAKLAPGTDARLNHYTVRDLPEQPSFDRCDPRIDR